MPTKFIYHKTQYYDYQPEALISSNYYYHPRFRTSVPVNGAILNSGNMIALITDTYTLAYTLPTTTCNTIHFG